VKDLKLYLDNCCLNRPFDAFHISCAVASDCDYFLITDRKLLNTPQEDIHVMNPIDFIREMGE
jgi:predicted nucleic acid-binding protein